MEQKVRQLLPAELEGWEDPHSGLSWEGSESSLNRDSRTIDRKVSLSIPGRSQS